MRRDNRYDLSGSSYLQEMDEKTTRYTNLVRRAERANRDHNGKPSKQEAEFYYEASQVCDEIMGMNLSQRAVYEQWKFRKLDCEDNVKRITDILAPPPPEPKPEPVVERNTQKVPNAPKAPVGPQTPASTTSGFTTRHYSKEVPLEKIAGWVRNVPEKGFEGVVGRTELKDMLLEEAAGFGWDKTESALDINPVKCYILYGPPGSGKTHLINAFASELKKRAAQDDGKEFTFLQLSGSDIHESYVGMAEKIVKTAFLVAEEHEPCLLFMDEIDNLCVKIDNKAEGHERRLTVEFMQAYNRFIKSGKRVVFMGATNHPGKVEGAMMDRCTRIPFPLPAEEDRAVFFEQMIHREKSDGSVFSLGIEPGFTAQDMAAATENHSYRDLERLRDSMLAKLKHKAIQENLVLDDKGKVNQKATDDRASNAILEGKVQLTRAMFEEAQREKPASDKTDSRRELQEFEDRVGGNRN